jgi:hypothetical protein
MSSVEENITIQKTKTMKQWIKLTVPAVAMALAGFTASANDITGTVNIGGSVNFNSTDLTMATMASFPTAGLVVSGTDSFATAFGASVTFKSFTFLPLPQPATPIDSIWSFTSGGLTYAFNLVSIADAGVTGPMGAPVTPGQAEFLQIDGSGTLDITGPGSTFDETPASWSFSVTQAAGVAQSTFTFAFSDSNNSLPDGGMTVMMLGAALTGLGFIKRKLA